MSKVYTVAALTGLALPADMPVKLSEEQLARRKHQVSPAKGKAGFYVSADRLNFKVGEKIEVDGDLPKALAVLTDEPPKAATPTPAKVDPGKPAVVRATPVDPVRTGSAPVKTTTIVHEEFGTFTDRDAKPRPAPVIEPKKR